MLKILFWLFLAVSRIQPAPEAPPVATVESAEVTSSDDEEQDSYRAGGSGGRF